MREKLSAYEKRFGQLLDMELDDQQKQMTHRFRGNPMDLQRSGLALFDLNATKAGTMMGHALIRLFRSDKPHEHLPYHQFRTGDMVLLSNAREKQCYEGYIFEHGKSSLTILRHDLPKELESNLWRVDQSGNRIAHDRCKEAVRLFSDPRGSDYCYMRNLILSIIKDDPETYANMPPPEPLASAFQNAKKSILKDWSLNETQQEIVIKTLKRRLTLIQGPPGTGKTHTAVHLVRSMIALLSMNAKNQSIKIACVGDSNAAVGK